MGIEGVDLYGGTRHSSMQFYRNYLSTEDVLRLSQHTTSKAGMRYLEIENQELLDGYALSGTPGHRRDTKKAKVTPISGRKD